VSAPDPSAPNRPTRLTDPRAVRVRPAAPTSPGTGDPIVIEPPAVPVGPLPRLAGLGVLGGVASPTERLQPPDPSDVGVVLADGDPLVVRLDRFDATHAVLVEADTGERTGAPERRTPLLLMPHDPADGSGRGTVRREVVIDGWSIVVELESERRAALRERAERGRAASTHGGPTEVRAIIPGQILSVSVTAGDPVVAGQQLLVVEAMKMQNELRAPRDGTVSQVAVTAGGTIEVGDLLLVLE